MKRKVMILVGIMTILIVMLLWCGTAMADSGTYRGISWDLTDGVLTLGREGETQVMSYKETEYWWSFPWSTSNSEITSLMCAGDIKMNGALTGMFWKCENLTSADVSRWDTSGVTNMIQLFCQCSSLTELDLSNWDTSSVTGMYGMFSDCSNLETLDISNFDTHLVDSFYQMFTGCAKLKTLDLLMFDSSNVTDMGYMFYNCSSLGELKLPDAFVTSVVTNIQCICTGCSGLKQINVSQWNVSNVSMFDSVFRNCSSLEALDVSHWNTSGATYMGHMFDGCSSLEVLDVSHFNTSNVTSMESMFDHCSNVSVIDLSGFDWSNVKRLSRCFQDCSSVKVLDLSSSSATNITGTFNLFYGCTNLEYLDVSTINLRKVTGYIDTMYQGCSSLTTVITGPSTPFRSSTNGSRYYADLPNPPSEKDGIRYTGKWIREDKTYGPYTASELRANYTSAMAGKWVWEKVPTEYSITFVCNEAGYLGDMPQVTAIAAEDYELPENAFRVFGYEFEYWTDGTRRTWEDKAIIPANTYAVGAEVTLTAVFLPRDRSIDMQDGAFDFSIKGNEKALFQPIPASTSYQVYEQTPFGWNLIKQVGNTGEIMPDEESEALFLNKYDPLKVTIRFAGTKLMDESAADPDSFNFLLYEDDHLIDIASVSEGGAIEFQPIEYDTAGDHHYYIKEVIGSDNTVEYDTHVEEITVSITSDGVGHLSADVTMDEDQILFENKSKPGILALRKLNATMEDREGVFYYEVQFSSENGQPYDLLSSDISYEEREGNVSDFPETQPLPGKPKYSLGIRHYGKTDGVNPQLIINRWEDHEAGEVVTLRAASMGTGNSSIKYRLESVDSGFVKMADGSWKNLMPAHNMDVKLIYGQYVDPSVRVSWNVTSQATPLDVVAILYANGTQVAEWDRVHVGETYRFENYPAYDAEGALIEYTIEVMAEDGYAVWPYGPGSSGYVYDYYYKIAPGLNGEIIWDDMDDYYGMRPDNVMVMCTFTTIHSSTAHPAYASDDWKFYFSSNYSLTDYPVTLTITNANMPAGYMLITPEDDSDLGKYDLKLKLKTTYIDGHIVWNMADEDDESDIVVKLYANDEYVDSRTISNGYNNYAYDFGERPTYDAEGNAVVYTVALSEEKAAEYAGEGYQISADGYDIVIDPPATVDIPIQYVTLLSEEEYLAYRLEIPLVSDSKWWLKTPDETSQYYVRSVGTTGETSGSQVGTTTIGVRPALICDLSNTELEVGDKISLANYSWTVISDSIILCDECVGTTRFHDASNYTGLDYNLYASSDLKVWLDAWVVENICTPTYNEYGRSPVYGVVIDDVTVLSGTEYTAYRDNVPLLSEVWWLRSPDSSIYAQNVSWTGSIAAGYLSNSGNVRPAIMVDSESSELNIGEKVFLAEYWWTVIGDSTLLCDACVGSSPFRKDVSAPDANVYEASDLKVWLANWASQRLFWTSLVVTATKMP